MNKYKQEITSEAYYQKQRYTGETVEEARKRIEEKRKRFALKTNKLYN